MCTLKIAEFSALGGVVGSFDNIVSYQLTQRDTIDANNYYLLLKGKML